MKPNGFKIKTVQSELTFSNNEVEKVYDKSFKFYDPINYESECNVIQRFADSKFCVKVHSINKDGYVMEELDFELGDDRHLNEKNVSRILFTVGIEAVLNMLDDMLKDLESRDIHHRDIHPGNILWSEKERVLKLTDFFWAEHSKDSVECPLAVNLIYNGCLKEYNNGSLRVPPHADDYSIDKIKNEITEVYNKMEPELARIYKDFQDRVAKDVRVVYEGRSGKVEGPYFDGSSIIQGWAYHVVDIPYFKKIQAHKDTCIGEYKTIKTNLPFTPESLLDIGCSAGYQVFNFMRDFNLKSAIGFENDPNVLDFLNQIKNAYYLDEVKFYQTFTDMTELKKVDVAIWLNSHMWVYKQIGKDRTLQAVRNVIEKSKVLFFQTSGSYSSGIFKVEEYKEANDIKKMLYSAGAVSVVHLKTTTGKHGAPRDMFMVKGDI